jgi:hypothetical protein
MRHFLETLAFIVFVAAFSFAFVAALHHHYGLTP